MSRERFSRLLQKYLNGECTPEEKSFVEHWFAMLDIERDKAALEANPQAIEDRIWAEIDQRRALRDANQPATLRPLYTRQVRWLVAAASLLLISGWLIYRFQPAEKVAGPLSGINTTVGSGWSAYTNTGKQTRHVVLEEGTVVDLAPNSSIRIPTHFAADRRTVILTGDAFFSVKRMPDRPFLVHTGTVITKVLGTSFFIRSSGPDKQVRVDVVTGKVAVYRQTRKAQQADGVILTPNQRVTFYEQEAHFVTGLVDAPKLISIPKEEKTSVSFHYYDTPLSDVIHQLEQAYGIAIEVETDALNECQLTANLAGQPMYTQLDLICAALHMTYEVRGTTILFSGKGCAN